MKKRTYRLTQLLHREPVFINPYTDYGFKKLFGTEANKDLLIDFLNQFLPENRLIEDVFFQNVENLADIEGERKAFFDVYCTARTGENFIVEMQKEKFQNFKDRGLYYSTFPIQAQAKVGTWSFKLKPVYFLGILDFEYDSTQKADKKLLRKVAFYDQDGDLFSDTLNFIFIQMPYFNKTEKELVTRLDKWLYFLKNLESFDIMPEIFNEPIFQKGFETARLAAMDRDDFFNYEASRLALMEARAFYTLAREEGAEKGREEVAQNLLLEGLSVEFVAKTTKLPFEKVKLIAKMLNLK